MVFITNNSKNKVQLETLRAVGTGEPGDGAIQYNLDLVTSNLVTTCDLVTIFQRPFFNLLHKIIRFSDIMRFSDSFCRDQKCH